jgi:hypothetical protein
MPIISQRIDYNGFKTKAKRLALEPLIDEAEGTLSDFHLSVLEEKRANGTRGIRQAIDSAFTKIDGWIKIASGGIDWTKRGPTGSTVGVEVQVSGRSDMLAVDIMHP